MSDFVSRARAFALEAHKNCAYGKLPYEFHLEAVVAALPEGASERLVAAAWLHDTVEDTDVTLGDVREAFGGHVARLVDAVTDEPGPNLKARKAATYKKLAVAPKEARELKLADRIANMQASIENPDKAAMYRKEYPEFMRHVATDDVDPSLVLRAFWLYLRSVESASNA